ncbi:hypothetical protein [Endozoicomonas sp. GU-1]|uniref:hypothetical protein n=1 Tax=Endozoicomonas sp. GU-1 TaxID=3009078 RepID=UPI0022B43C95|nr:hypothetical protein [Endozoicomonas sp. GU-1]WBA82103.1 hypothetical protein O2T12_02735 [Endozoicomonas sp. GU-1]WBA85047.1 hypothetical protein O3276_17475 [Endozoicomonas sp. GU-1]
MSIETLGLFGNTTQDLLDGKDQYLLVHTTKNQEKVDTGDDVLTSFFGSNQRTVRIKPPIENLLTPTQPVGDDIKFGATSRIDVVKEMMAERNLFQDASIEAVLPRVYISFENGLRVKPDGLVDVVGACIEIDGKSYYGESEEVPVRVNQERISMMTDEIRKELGPDADVYDFKSHYHTLNAKQKEAFNLMIFGHRDGCDAKDAVPEPQVAGLRQRVIEELKNQGVRDYWRIYTDDRLTRKQGLSQAVKNAVNDFISKQSGEDKLRLVQTLKQSLISRGLPASLGDRYGQTVWMRDFGIMAYTLSKQDVTRPEAHKKLTDSLASIASKQFDSGLIPQVVIPDPYLSEFVYQRVLGGDTGNGWYYKLRDYMKEKFPEITLPTLDSESLKTIAPEELKTILNQLYANYLMAKETGDPGVPNPTHTLRGLLTDTLGTLTPGTTDSEIHFIRSMTKLLELAGTQEQKDDVRKLVPNLAHAMAYLDKKVLDPANGLPQGGDNRDMLDTWMYQKLLCSNACFLYQGFTGLAHHLEEIGPQLKIELSKHFPPGTTPVSGFISALLDDNPQAVSDELAKFKQLIKETFLYNQDGKFDPRDFVHSDNPTGRESMNKPMEYISPLVNANKDFLEGKEVNLQGLALAIENGLIQPEDHPAVVKLIRSQLTKAGLKVFSPINMANGHEKDMLINSKGFLVWPQIEYRIIDALTNHMESTPEVKELLLELHEAGERRNGLHEWYNTYESVKSGESGEKKEIVVYGGGATGQAWSIMLMDKALSPANLTGEEAMEVDEGN